MLNEKKSARLKRRDSSYFMERVYRFIPKMALNDHERYVLSRDCFRLTWFTLATLSVLLPLGLIVETLLLVSIPNIVFFRRWYQYSHQMAAVRLSDCGNTEEL
ncbi:MAG: hypothetical protein MI864_09030 [Pseudomonadales bacterium]|nr:hypothetical protein [Pseudomonadales bacterium]